MKATIMRLRHLAPLVCVCLLAGGLSAADGTPSAGAAPPLPRLVDLGADKCIPCRMMASVLSELTRDFNGQLTVEFIDVWKNPGQGEPYGIRMIPTQVFFDAAGKERFRHEGYMSKKDILAKWRELGVELKAPSAAKKS